MSTPMQQNRPRKVQWPTRMIKKFSSLSEFTTLSNSGEGAFSRVIKAMHNESGKVYAIKQVRPPSTKVHHFCLFLGFLTFLDRLDADKLRGQVEH